MRAHDLTRTVPHTARAAVWCLWCGAVVAWNVLALHTERARQPCSMADCSLLTMACLGRPLKLGMLYDCRSDQLLPGVTLWDTSQLQETIDKCPLPETECHILTEDTIRVKAHSLGIHAGLKLSTLADLVSVSGSAKFLYNHRESKHQARVTLQYSMTSHFEQLAMPDVDKIQYSDVFERGNATHVVTGVVYGVDAFFVFNRHVEKDESVLEIYGKMAAAVNGIPEVTISGEGELKIEDAEKAFTDEMTCQFHGDILLPENPTTFKGAVEMYKRLPKFIAGDSENMKVVPKRVWLYPLCKLNSKAAQLMLEVSPNLVNLAQSLSQCLQDLAMQANDLISSEVCSYFVCIRKQISLFLRLISSYDMYITKQLSSVLPQVRGGSAKEDILAEVFQRNSASPFNCDSLSLWLQGKVQENQILQEYLDGLKDKGDGDDNVLFTFSPGELDGTLMDLSLSYAICFAFKVPCGNDPFLQKLSDYLNDSSCTEQSTQLMTKEWFQDMTLISEIKAKAKVFKALASATGKSESIKFLVTHLEEDDTKKGSAILLYNGSGPLESYQPPDKPSKPEMIWAASDRIYFTWSAPQNGKPTHYTFCYRQKRDHPHQWKEGKAGITESAILSNLNSETTYLVKIRAHFEIGLCLDSDVSNPIKTAKGCIIL